MPDASIYQSHVRCIRCLPTCEHPFAASHTMSFSGCILCPCSEFEAALSGVQGERPAPPIPPEPEDIEQYLNEVDPMPPLAAGLVSLIEAGLLDRYLELILNSAHNRKRARRGTPGFREGLRRRR